MAVLAVVDVDTVKEAVEEGMTETQITAKASRITRLEALTITVACTAAVAEQAHALCTLQPGTPVATQGGLQHRAATPKTLHSPQCPSNCHCRQLVPG